jgi:hypothetical protein
MQSATFDGQLLVLMVMLCSSLVINVKSNLTEADLDRLACFSRMARMIAGDRSTVSLVYPSLVFLIRDSFLKFTPTKEAYLEELLRGTDAEPEPDEDDLSRAQRESRQVS